jgi:hypothetical protein
MNQDEPAGQDDIGRRSPSLLEAVATHPFGTTAGVIGGALLGFVAGMAAGPLGSLVLAVGGALLGGAIGSSFSVGPEIDMSTHDSYWREHHASRPYVPAGADYADYGPAYRHGTRESLRAAAARDWRDAEADLARGWDANKGASRLSWEEAKPAVRDAWDRLQSARR